MSNLTFIFLALPAGIIIWLMVIILILKTIEIGSDIYSDISFGASKDLMCEKAQAKMKAAATNPPKIIRLEKDKD